MDAATDARASADTSRHPTLPPSAASRTAVARPIPDAAPVTITDLPSKRFIRGAAAVIGA